MDQELSTKRKRKLREIRSKIREGCIEVALQQSKSPTVDEVRDYCLRWKDYREWPKGHDKYIEEFLRALNSIGETKSIRGIWEKQKDFEHQNLQWEHNFFMRWVHNLLVLGVLYLAVFLFFSLDKSIEKLISLTAFGVIVLLVFLIYCKMFFTLADERRDMNSRVEESLFGFTYSEQDR